MNDFDSVRPAHRLFKRMDGRVAIITGSTRGIGRECALALAKQGCSIVVAAKTVTPQPTLPGTIYTVAAEIEAMGGKALAVKCDLRDDADITACIEKTMAHFGRVDILVNNASALWWQDIVDTPAKKMDLIVGINARGSFLMTQACLPHMADGGFGRVITMSPPIAHQGFAGRTAYNISKMGMTMVAMGVAEEYKGMDITGNSLWPATIVESYASINFQLGNPADWRKATILSDAVVAICSEGESCNGKMLIDDEYLVSRGLSQDELIPYRFDPSVEPPRVIASHDWGDTTHDPELFKRGTVREVNATKSKL